MIRIITDSTADFTLEETKSYNIEVVPLKTMIDDVEYLDRYQLQPEPFYEMLSQTNTFPKTSQPSPNDFFEYFKEGIKAHDQIIVFCVSSKLSGTYQSANIAKMTSEYEDIYIVDSEIATLGMKMLVLKAIECRNQGMSFEDIIHTIEDYKKRIRLFAIVDTLEYFVMGGRLSKTSGMVGSMLKLKPILTVVDGQLEAIDKKRGTSKAITRVIELIHEQGDIDLNEPIYFGYTGNNTSMDKFIKAFHDEFQINNYEMGIVGPVVGSHAGPGAQFITYLIP